MDTTRQDLEKLEREIQSLKKELEAEKQRAKRLENAYNLAQKELKSASDRLSGSGRESLDKSQFLAKMTHELRTPLNGIVGMSNILLKTALTSEQREHALVIAESGRALLELINDFLDFSKIESGKAEMEILDFELTSCVEAIADLLSEQARLKGLELLTFISPSLPQVVRGDPGYVRQVLLNLASNAVKFTQTGHVLIKAELEPESGNGSSLKVRFTVEDTGIGIEKQAQAKLFAPFTQASLAVKREYGGTGLGLSISKGLVDLMDGEITVESTPGRGACFHVTIPLSRAVKPTRPPLRCETMSGQRCLIVSKSEILSTLLENYVRSFGMLPIRTDNTTAAVSALMKKSAKAPIGVALIDADSMGDPAAFCPRPENAQGIGLICLTSVMSEEMEAELLTIGWSNVLTKPVKLWALHSAIDHALSKTPSHRLDKRLTQQIPRISHLDKMILIADDSPVNQKVAILQLKSLGLPAVAVGSGEEAVTACLTGKYSLVLMDCQMANMDGYEATAAIRQAERMSGKHTPIIAVTGVADPDDLERCRRSGMDDIISKPVDPNRLKDVIDRHLTVHTGNTPVNTPRSETQERLTISQSMVKPDAAAIAATPLRDPVDYLQLEKTCGPDVAREILRVYLSAAETLLEGIQEARDLRDKVALESLAHQLRGSSIAVGAREIVQLAEKVELIARKEDWIEAKSTLDSLRYSFSRLKTFAEKLT